MRDDSTPPTLRRPLTEPRRRRRMGSRQLFVVRTNEEMSIALQSVSLLSEGALLQGLVRGADEAEAAGGAAPAEDAQSPEIERAAEIVSGKDGLYVASHHVDNFTNPLVAQVGAT